MHVANERQIQLHDLRLERGEAREPRISGAQVVDRKAEARAPQRVRFFRNILDVLDRRALRHFEYYACRNLREWRAEIVKIGVEQIARVEVDEEQRVSRCPLERLG